ncbi:uncharacterized protein LOC128391839 isoform X2 [Panonychus citri]|uniref:uncharacterized protein LOC128391839 isoform X2 n=1 Tax=Panonychus citri TaxID=50023 RepID=UPI002306DF31|nr:uncharacterized protein LOC128391839 isoform X2 [Panonychus citri]
MRISVFLCPVLLIICVHLNGATLFSLLGKKNYILAKPRIIIKPKIYIGTHPLLLGKKKALAAKAVAGLGVVGILKKLKPKISLPKIELPRFGLPKIPLSFSVSLDKPNESTNEDEVEDAAEAAADAVRNAAHDDVDHIDHHSLTSKKLSSSKYSDLSWISDPPVGFSPYDDEFSVGESKAHRSDKLKQQQKQSTKSNQQSSPSTSSSSSQSSGSSNSYRSRDANDDEEDFKAKFKPKEISKSSTRISNNNNNKQLRRRPVKSDDDDEDDADDER